MRSARGSLRHAICLALVSVVLASSSPPPVLAEVSSSQIPDTKAPRPAAAKPKQDAATRSDAAPGSAGRPAAKTAGRTTAKAPAAGDATRTPPKRATAASEAKAVKAPAKATRNTAAKAPAKGTAKAIGKTALQARPASASARCTYAVKKGDTVTRIAARNDVSPAALASANHLAPKGGLPVGKRLTIPGCGGAERPAVPPEVWADGVMLARVGPRKVPTALHLGLPELRGLAGTLLWPVPGSIASPFGPRRGGWHAGVDIKADVGTPILAAAAGTVLVSAWEPAYGRVIKIEHDDGLVTIYAHNLQNRVSPGDRVEAGAVIGAVGSSGRSTAYHLHFEVRRDGMAYNPLHLLPERDMVIARAVETGETDAEEAEDEFGR